MPSLDETFDELEQRLKEPAALAAARTDPFYYFVYAPDEALAVKSKIPAWEARLRLGGLQVEHVSFADLIWELVDESGRWEGWLAEETEADPELVNDSVRDVLASSDALTRKLAALVDRDRPNSILFLTEVELLHPYFRVRTFESALHDRVKIPVVAFYPGRRIDQYGLSFLGFYPEDGNYRAMIVGGQP